MQIPCPACQSPMTVPSPAGVAVAAAPAAVHYAPTPPPPIEPAAPQAATCPNCGGAVAPRAILCIKCGTNLRTGQKMGRPGMPGVGVHALRAPAAPSVWYKTPYPYLGAYMLILAVTYLLAPGNPIMQLAFACTLLLFLFGTYVATAVFAFKDDGMGKGFLCLCIGIYAIYYVTKVSERQFLKVIYGIAFVLGLAAKFGAFDRVLEK